MSLLHALASWLTPFPIHDDCPALIKCKQRCQSVVGLIVWLAQSTCPDLSPTHSVLSTYNNKPSKSHWNAALYALHYIHCYAINYGFMFTSTQRSPLHTCMSFPQPLDTDAYTNAIPPSKDQHHRLTTYSNVGHSTWECHLRRHPAPPLQILQHERRYCYATRRPNCLEGQPSRLHLPQFMQSWSSSN